MTPEARAVWASFEFRVPMLLRNVEPLTESQIRWRPGPGRNSIRWQLWHIAEVEDNWVRTCLLRDEPHYPFVTSLADADLEHDSPRKSDLLEYLQQVRTLTKKRLEALSAEDFEATLDLMREVRFDDAFTYKFSPREGTPATRMPDAWSVPDDEAQARLEQLIRVARGIQAEINEGEVGRVEEVLVEKEARDPGEVLGRTRRNKAVVFEGGADDIGRYRTVRLARTTGATFAGEVVSCAASQDRRRGPAAVASG